jgi:hypothetical protein
MGSSDGERGFSKEEIKDNSDIRAFFSQPVGELACVDADRAAKGLPGQSRGNNFLL